MQQRRLQIPNEKELINQLECFEYEASEKAGTAQPKLHAPKGLHDDEVDALALMCYGLTKGRGYMYSSFVSSADAKSKGGSFEDYLNKNSMKVTHG